ncbi:MAG: NlpC/P60 family protein [Propionibacteriaceae bacterium]
MIAGPGVSPASADPPLTVAEAKAEVAQLETDAAALDEQALEVRQKLATGTKQLAMKQEDVRQQTAKVARIRKQVGQVALAQFQNRNLDTTAQLFFNEDTDGFLNKMATVEKVSENQNTILQDFQGQQARLADLERSAKVDVATLQTQDKELARLRVASKAKITESKAVLAKLTEEERQRIAAEEAAAQAAAQKAAEEAAAANNTSTSTDSSDDSSGASDPGTGSTSSSGKGAVALAYAIKQIGKPYVFGADGPSSFDCSGLTSAAWRAAGVSIPRTSRTQSTGGGRSIAKSDLKPGDLVFFYSPVSHVAIYAGNGMVVHAPHPGASVRYIKMKYMPYAGARRPA